jgi:CubicO group peptidase (beta-lactamase class C family)
MNTIKADGNAYPHDGERQEATILPLDQNALKSRVNEILNRQWVTAAASSIYSTPRDMARYVAALLGGGSGEHGSILNPETLVTMFEPHYQPDPRIPGVGLAFFRDDLGGHLAIEHQGILPGFNSQIYLAPTRASVCSASPTARGMRWSGLRPRWHGCSAT